VASDDVSIMSKEVLASAARLRVLYELGCAFTARLELDELVPLIIAKSREVLDAEGAAILLIDRERNELFSPYVAQENPEVAALLIRLRVPADRGIAGAVIQGGRCLRIDDVQSDRRFYPEVDRATGSTTRSLLAAPLISHHGTIGVIQVVNRRGGGPFTDEDLAFLEALAGSIAAAIDNARLYTQVKASEERLRTQVGALRRDIARRERCTEMIGTGPAMAEVFHLMETAGASPITVLIEGETGTGKELVARGIHRTSTRADGAFIAVNCAAVAETLLESQLFGHRRGAFTGAIQDQRGLFEAATGGTIFLDEVGETPAPMQAKLLRVLQEGEIVPVGETRPRKVDVRVISATNRDLAAGVASGTVRRDLYYRLAAFPIRLPALRDRREDIPLLADRMLSAAGERHRKRFPGIAPAALECLMRFDWPGNVRELENEIERAVALARDGETIGPEHLSAKVHVAAPESEVRGGAAVRGGVAARAAGTPVGGANDPATATGAVDDTSTQTPPEDGSTDPPGEAPKGEGAGRPVGTLRRARSAFEARYVAEVLRQHGGNVSRAAEALGLSRVMLQKKMKGYGLR
jgi:transcriptional regulator with GAF, ATPase, and Fis domain